MEEEGTFEDGRGDGHRDRYERRSRGGNRREKKM
jgi:hypothetical protein